MSQMDMNRAKANNKQLCKNVLLQNAEFVSAVQSQSVESAASAAAEIMVAMLAQQQAAAAAHHKNAAHRGMGNLWGMQEVLFSKGDSVRLKHHLAARNPDAGEGTIVEVHKVEDGPPTFVVKWASGAVLKQAVGDLMKCNVAVGHGSGAPREKMHIPMEYTPPKSLKNHSNKHRGPALKLAKDIMDFEETVPWKRVKESFRSRRTEWRNQCKAADSVSAIAALLKELLAVVTIAEDMPNTPFLCIQDHFLKSLSLLAAGHFHSPDADPMTQVSDMWEKVIKPELNRWIEVHDTRASHLDAHAHVANSIQALESCAGHSFHSYKQAPIAWMLASYHERDLMRRALRDELEFCRGKLSQIERNPAQLLTEGLLRGVTYDHNGVGGSYGGAPRSSRDMLNALMCYDSDDSELDAGSEATDLHDSCELLLEMHGGEAQCVDSADPGRGSAADDAVMAAD